MKYHNSYLTSVVANSGEYAMLAGVAGGRVRYDPLAVWLYSLRFFFLWYKWEILWTTGEKDACKECAPIPLYANDSSLSREGKLEGTEQEARRRIRTSDTGE